MNKMLAYVKRDGKKLLEEFDGEGFEYKGVALHIRRISSTIWLISLFNCGLKTRGVGRTIKEAIEKYDANDGAIIEEWKYQIGRKRLYELATVYFESNKEQLIQKTYDPNSGRLVIGPKIKAGDLI